MSTGSEGRGNREHAAAPPDPEELTDLQRALKALRLEVPAAVADDVERKVNSALEGQRRITRSVYELLVKEKCARRAAEAAYEEEIRACADAEHDRDSLRLALDAEKHNHRHDNEYLIGERDRLEAVLRDIVGALDQQGLGVVPGAAFLAARDLLDKDPK